MTRVRSYAAYVAARTLACGVYALAVAAGWIS